MKDELICQLAMTLIPNIGDARARALVNHFGDARSIFSASLSSLQQVEGINSALAKSIKAFDDFSLAEKEKQFIERYGIQAIFLTDPAYPQRLLNCYDAPVLLFYKGTANLNASRTLAIVGTRLCTDYGRHFTEKLIQDLSAEGITIISGLAYGIDAAAHKAAIKHQLPTIGVVAHGIDKIYPADHATLAKEMIYSGGGLLTEFFSGTKADKHHFPLRNRIVAGMADATLVIETEIKGGSMITAKLADAYNRDVFALPGRITDKKSSGCNRLIQYQNAIMLTDAKELLQVMGWQTERKPQKKKQRALFIEMTQDEKKIVALLEGKECMHIDEINFKSGLSSSAIAAAILNLELQHIVSSLPGKMYQLA
ncbi:MAG TPA: DNA-processing protein DprA [Flavisolibacter sp.]|nr:DNA-processing protein DprA [Flavisolibacter sp.]